VDDAASRRETARQAAPTAAGGAPGRGPARLAAAVVAIEAGAVLGFAGWLGLELLIADTDDPQVAQGSGLYFLVCGGALVVLAVHLWRRSRWAYGAAVAVQLLVLLVCWSMVQAGFWLGAVAGAALVGICLAALLRPSGRAAFDR
jgi:hypothetical protein